MYKQQTDASIAEAYLHKARDAYRLKILCRFGRFAPKGKTYREGMAIVKMTALKILQWLWNRTLGRASMKTSDLPEFVISVGELKSLTVNGEDL